MVPAVTVKALAVGYGQHIVQEKLSFSVARGDVFIIMGTSGCGKSTLLKTLLGLERPLAGEIHFDTLSFLDCSPTQRQALRLDWGVTFQSGGLISTMTVAENLALPLQLHTRLAPALQKELIAYKLSLVGLYGTEQKYPTELSGGMRKRVALARAIMLDPHLLFFDEPSAGLDPISSRRLDELILTLADSMGATVIMVTHELDSIFSIASNSVFLDSEARTQLDQGPPRRLRDYSENAKVREFLTRATDREPHER